MEDNLFDPIEYLIRHPYMNYLDIKNKVEIYKKQLFHAQLFGKDESYLKDMLKMLRSVRTMIWVRQFALKDMSNSGYKHVYETRFLDIKEQNYETIDIALLKQTFIQYNMYKECLTYSSDDTDNRKLPTSDELTNTIKPTLSIYIPEWKAPEYIKQVRQKIIEDDVKTLLEKVRRRHKQKYSHENYVLEEMSLDFESQPTGSEPFATINKEECPKENGVLNRVAESQRKISVGKKKRIQSISKSSIGKNELQSKNNKVKDKKECSVQSVPAINKSLANKILDLLSDGEPRKALEIASKLKCNKREVNSKLYSELKNKVWCNSQYQWSIKK